MCRYFHLVLSVRLAICKYLFIGLLFLLYYTEYVSDRRKNIHFEYVLGGMVVAIYKQRDKHCAKEYNLVFIPSSMLL